MSEPLKAQVLDATQIMKADDRTVAGIAAEVLAAFDMKRPSFNFAAAAYGQQPVLTPVKDKLYFYDEADQPLVEACLKVLSQYEKTQKVSNDARENLVIEHAQRALRNLPGIDKSSDQFKEFAAQTMEHIQSKLQGIGSLAASAPYGAVTYSMTPKKPNSPS